MPLSGDAAFVSRAPAGRVIANIKLPEWLLSIRFTVKIDVFPFDSWCKRGRENFKLDHFLRIL